MFVKYLLNQKKNLCTQQKKLIPSHKYLQGGTTTPVDPHFGTNNVHRNNETNS